MVKPKIKNMKRIKKFVASAAAIGSIAFMSVTTMGGFVQASLEGNQIKGLTQTKNDAIVEYLADGNELGELSPRMREDVRDAVECEVPKSESGKTRIRVSPVIVGGRVMSSVGFSHNEARDDAAIDEFIDSKTAVGDPGPGFEELVSKVDDINSEIDEVKGEQVLPILGITGGCVVGGAGYIAAELAKTKIKDDDARVEEDLGLEQ